MKLQLFIILVLTNIFYLNAQKSMDPKLNGTFIYATICQDGIVFTADSRANFSDKGNKIFYTDNVQKLFVSGNYIVMCSGIKNSFGKFVESHISKMDDKYPISPKEWMVQFALIIQSEYSAEEYDHIMANLLFIIGGLDENHKPSLCGTKDKELTYISQGVITNHPLERDNLFFAKLNFQKTVTLMKKDIQSYVLANNSELDIGGAFTTLTMDTDGVINYLEKPKTINWTSFEEMKKYFLNNLNITHPIYPYTLNDVKMVLNKK